MNRSDNITLQATLDNDNGGKSTNGRRTTTSSDVFAWLGRISILAGLVAAPWMLGAVPYWAQFWLAVATLLGLGFWWFETALNRRRKQVLPYVFLFLLLAVLLGGLQLVSLPDGLANLGLGRQQEIYARYSVEGQVLSEEVAADVSRISLNREGTWEQIRLLLIAISALLLGARLFRSQLHINILLATLTINGIAISFFGFIQKLTSNPNTIFWVIELSQGGQPFGPFVNRNNAAGYLLMCLAAAVGLMVIAIGKQKNPGPIPLVSKEMPPWRQAYFILLYFVSELTATKLACLLGVGVISTGVFASLSRGGVIAMCVAAIGTLLVYGLARRPKNASLVLVPLVGFIILLSSWVGFGEQLTERFESTEIDLNRAIATEKRFQHWRDTYPAAFEMGWFGAGLGSYEGVHRIYRTDRETSVFVFAENQYFQALIEAGWPGLVLFLAAWILCWIYARTLIYRGKSVSTIAIGTLGIFLVISQASIAFVDFGLYIPANTILMSVLVGFVAYHAHALSGRLKKGTWLKYEAPNWLVQAVLLLVFVGITMACLDLKRRTRIEQLTRTNVRNAGYADVDLETTEATIQELSPLLARTVSIDGLNALGDLWVHRCRLQIWEELESLPAFTQIQGENEAKVKERLWELTRLSRVHEYLKSLEQQSEMLAAQFIGRDFIPYNLDYARRYYTLSRYSAPLQPDVHLQIGRINAVYGDVSTAKLDLERAVELAPTNAEIRNGAARIYLQQGDFENAGKHFRRSLELAPKSLTQIISLLKRFSIKPIENRLIFETFLPEDPQMLYRFATRFVLDDIELRKEIFEKADGLLVDVSPSDKDELLLSANLKLGLGLREDGLQLLEDVLVSDPGDEAVRFRLAKLYLSEGKLRRALEFAQRLARGARKKPEYLNFLDEVQEAIKANRNNVNEPQPTD